MAEPPGPRPEPDRDHADPADDRNAMRKMGDAMRYDRESFERGPELGRQGGALPAATYNLSRRLLAASPAGCVFVPIRAMQYLAVVDPEEIIFVDSQYRRWVALAWREFRPGERRALDAPVAYQALFYTPDGSALHQRLQSEFARAQRFLEQRPAGTGQILEFRSRSD